MCFLAWAGATRGVISGARVDNALLNDPALVSLLALLADGKFHSGQELGERLGVSRTAIWKQVQKLIQLELPLTSTRGQGYRLEGGLELLNKEIILTSLNPAVKDVLTERSEEHTSELQSR